MECFYVALTSTNKVFLLIYCNHYPFVILSIDDLHRFVCASGKVYIDCKITVVVCNQWILKFSSYTL